ncbi:non-ribosomal peptide synthetase [Streptomyces sp. NBC_01717]|uniref:non-ribosomal peptide synthetase n=1 Tax=Streptomyces sp. NBC_01717 TaxID=2975918 RepID=UPI002E34DAC9|nr:non-ribosomal peptide synthetase [Streptomyces sp. NBC_01717]
MQLSSASNAYVLEFEFGTTVPANRIELVRRAGSFAERELARMCRHFVALAAGACAEPEVGLLSLSAADADERDEVLGYANAGPHPRVEPVSSVIARFEAAVARRPDAPAVRCRGRELSYAELDAESRRIAASVREAGVATGDVVGLVLERSVEAIAAIIGVLRAGCAYLPLDPQLPAERIRLIVDDASPRLLLTQNSTTAAVRELSIARCSVDAQPESATRAGTEAPEPKQPAYVMYTSGSTGRPKGVVVSHENVGALLDAAAEHIVFREDDVWMCSHALNFDVSVFEIWGALAHGGLLVLATREQTVDPIAFSRLIAEQRITVLSQTPSSFYRMGQRIAALADAGELSLRLVLFAGEGLSWGKTVSLLADHMPELVLVNMYGITECTVHVTALSTPVKAANLVAEGSIGRPMSHGACYVLDDSGNLSAVGESGELHVGGRGVALGYVNRPEEMERRFIPDPFAGPGAVMYRSGDLAKWTLDGELIYLGRRDRQVKVRGYRIECAEVEAALAGCRGVTGCTVAQAGDELVAFVTCSDGTGDISERLRRVLPDYMVPSRVVEVDELPLTANGKMDVEALKALLPSTAASPRGAGRLTEQERRVREKWAYVLGHDEFTLESNFFDVGGHSFAAAMLQGLFVAEGVDITVLEIMRYPTVKTFAAFLADGHRSADDHGVVDRARRQRQVVINLARGTKS